MLNLIKYRISPSKLSLSKSIYERIKWCCLDCCSQIIWFPYYFWVTVAEKIFLQGALPQYEIRSSHSTSYVYIAGLCGLCYWAREHRGVFASCAVVVVKANQVLLVTGGLAFMLNSRMVLYILLRGDQHRCWVEELPTWQILAPSLCSSLLCAQNTFPENAVPCRCCSWAGTARWRLEGQRLPSKKPLQWTWLVLQLCRPEAVTCCYRFKAEGIAVWAGHEGRRQLVLQ